MDGGSTTLVSPVLDLTGLVSPRVVYARWFSNDQGASPFSDVFVVEVSSNGGAGWVNLETVGPTGPEVSGGWFVKQFRISDFVPVSSQFRIRFTAADAPPGSIVEAAIDAFGITDTLCASCNDGILNQGELRIDCGGPCVACQCTADSDCFDTVFCNGTNTETCDAFGFCQPGPDPCPGAVCDETSDSCVACLTDDNCADADACTFDECIAQSCSHVPAAFGDIDNSGSKNVFDLFCILDALAGDFAGCPVVHADIDPCTGNGVVNVFDLFAVLDALDGQDLCCAGP